MKPATHTARLLIVDDEPISLALLEENLGSRYEIETATSGAAALDLGLDIPVDDRPTRVEGNLKLAGNTIAVPSLRSDLEQVRGNIRFNEAGLLNGALEASYLGQAI